MVLWSFSELAWAKATCGVLLVAIIIVYLIPSPIDPKPIIFKDPPPRLQGALSSNTKLQKAQRLFEGQIIGPESFAADRKGFVYTGTSDGRVWKIHGNSAEVLAQTGSSHPYCGHLDMEAFCGRPKGMKVSPDGALIVADAYKGLLSINTTTGNITVLLTEVDGVPFKFLNALDITKDGVVYFTDSSTKWSRRHHKYEVIETNNLGRVLKYDLKTGQATKVLDGLYLANGIALAPDESFFIVSQMSICKISRHYLLGTKAGQTETFLNNVPGYPDNIKPSKRATFYVGMAVARFQGASRLGPFLDLVGPYPALKRLIAKVTPFFVYDIFIPKHTYFIELDLHGNILSSFHDPSGKVIYAISEAYQHDEHVYIGHFAAPFVGRVNVKDLYA